MNKREADENFLGEAFKVAFRSMRNNLGGPFGAVVVRDGQVIGKGSNMVTSENDPTAHAEIVAIRNACKETGTFDLAGAILYATCEPCPMCLSAIYWAHISEVIYVSTRYEAESIGFLDNHIYQELGLSNEQRSLKISRINDHRGSELFNEWVNKSDKNSY